MATKSKDNTQCFRAGLPGFLLWEASTLWQRVLSNELGKIELTPVQFYLLSGLNKLSGDGDKVTQIDLARFTNMNVMMASNVLRTLEKKNLIKRLSNPKDSRANILELTEEGSNTWHNAIEIIKSINHQFFDMESDETKRFVEYLKKLLENESRGDGFLKR